MKDVSKLSKLIGYAILVVGSILCFAQFAFLTPSVRTPNTPNFSQKVNLALRRTADHLLRRAGDSTSRIEPVKQLNEYVFVIQLNQAFDYEQLPRLLNESFRVHNIRENYDVAILDCAHGEVQLGYAFKDLIDSTQIPCIGRQQPKGCYNLQVTFAAPEPKPYQASIWWMVPLCTLVLGLGYVVWRKSLPVARPYSSSEPVPDSLTRIQFGTSSFDTTTQTLTSGSGHHNLTYREAKLLRFLLNHPNQIVSRDFILKSVWEDEGITVGRSVDVFISRLRKLLQDDPSIRIVAVHGVGYRLDIQA